MTSENMQKNVFHSVHFKRNNVMEKMQCQSPMSHLAHKSVHSGTLCDHLRPATATSMIEQWMTWRIWQLCNMYESYTQYSVCKNVWRPMECPFIWNITYRHWTTLTRGFSVCEIKSSSSFLICHMCLQQHNLSTHCQSRSKLMLRHYKRFVLVAFERRTSFFA